MIDGQQADWITRSEISNRLDIRAVKNRRVRAANRLDIAQPSELTSDQASPAY